MCLFRTFNWTRVTPFGELVSVVESPGGYNPQGPVSEEASERLRSAVKTAAPSTITGFGDLVDIC